jgi:myosin V
LPGLSKGSKGGEKVTGSHGMSLLQCSGASVQTYLLEKVRLPNQSENERNFHIFYQLCAGASEEQREALHLGEVHEYHYVNQGNCFTLRHVDDRDEFEATQRAMRVLGFGDDVADTILRIIAGLMHLGQTVFCPTKDDGSDLDGDSRVQTAMDYAASLCYLEKDYMMQVLTTRVVETRTESFTVKLRPDQALDARDALAKALYGRLFNWIVAKINRCISTDLRNSRASVSVLDIFGFECFKNNSFEQLCINYTNETLQQQFNRFVFKMEQDEYERESISWSFVSFPDNQDCLDLIECRPNGILAMLDDECRLPKGTDEKFVARVQKDLGSHPRFFVTNRMKAEHRFGVRHYGE